MTTNTDTNNDIIVPEIDPGNPSVQTSTNPSLEQTQMQVARKESSSGFMLLSVRHTSNIGNLTNTNGRGMYPLEEDYSDDYARAASVQASSNTLLDDHAQIGRHFSSTMSLEAEEYDNDEEDAEPHSEPNQFAHQQHFVTRSPPSNYNPARIATLELPTNDTQIAEGLRPAAVSNLARIQVPPVGTPIKNTVVQSHNNIRPQRTSEQVPSGVINQGNPDMVSGMTVDPSVLTSTTQHQSVVLGSTQVLHPSIQSSEILPIKYCDPSGVGPTFVAVTTAAAGGPQVNLTPSQKAVSVALAQPPIQYIIDQINAESMRSSSEAPISNSLLTSLNAQTQPASRFRKARIHEAVEQWSSNRLSLHDCRLKAVPEWVSYTQSKSIDTSNHPLVQRGRCLYCFVPGGFGCHCNSHKHNQVRSTSKVQKSALPTVPETSELSHILQATFTAYRAASQQGYNLSTLLSTWNSGERVSSRSLLEQVDHPLLSENGFGLKTNTSEPIQLCGTHLEVAGHNSTDVIPVLPPGNEDFCNEGLTMVAQPTAQAHHPSELPILLEQPQAHPNCISPSRLNPSEASDTRIFDPSNAYLRRHITLSSEESEAARSDGVPYSHAQTQPPTTFAVAPPGQRLIAPPPTSPTTASHLQRVGVNKLLVEGAASVSPRTLDSLHSSGTAAPSVQLSPDTEIAGMTIPRAPDPSSAGSSRVTTSGHNLATMLAAVDPMGSENATSLISGASIGAQPQPVTPIAIATPVVSVNLEAESAADRAVAAVRAAAMAPSPTLNTPGSTAMDFTAAARNLFKAAEAVANACASGNGQNAAPQLSPPPPSGVAPVSSSSSASTSTTATPTTTTTTSVAGNLEAPVPKCMDVIRVAIMDTLRDHYAQLSSEIEVLRAKVNSLQKENIHLQNYKQAFMTLRPFLSPETWEQINQQIKAAESAQQLRNSAQESPGTMVYPQQQTQQQQQHFFPPSTVTQQLNSAFQTQQQQQHLSSHVPPQNTAPQ